VRDGGPRGRYGLERLFEVRLAGGAFFSLFFKKKIFPPHFFSPSFFDIIFLKRVFVWGGADKH
jgi:hypothetical protein